MKNKLRRILAVTTALSLSLVFTLVAHAGGGPEYPVRDGVQENVLQREPDTRMKALQKMYPPLKSQQTPHLRKRIQHR